VRRRYAVRAAVSWLAEPARELGITHTSLVQQAVGRRDEGRERRAVSCSGDEAQGCALGGGVGLQDEREIGGEGVCVKGSTVSTAHRHGSE
jgi:hypothetical protein